MPPLSSFLAAGHSQPAWKAVFVALLLVAAATGAQMSIGRYFGDVFPWVCYCFGVFAAAWWGGMVPTLLALVLGYIAASVLFVDPGSLRISGRDSFAGLVVYLAYGLFAGVIAESLHRSRRRSQQAAREAMEERERLRVTLSSIGDAVIVTDARGRIDSLNPVAEQLVGWSTGEAQQRPLADVFRIVDERTSAESENPVDRVLREGRVVGLANHTALIRRDGSRVAIADSAAPIHSAEGRTTGVVLIFRDVTEQRRAEDALPESEGRLRTLNDSLERRVAERTSRLDRQTRQLRMLANELTQAEQRERQNLAQTLHDGLQQMLVGMKMQLPLCTGADAVTHLSRVEEILDDTIRASRSLVAELSPPILHDSGLPEALEWLARWFEEKHGFRVELEVARSLPEIPEGIKIFLFQAIREMLLNALRHSGVQTAFVGLVSNEDSLEAVVQDRGQGFASEPLTEETDHPLGFGLFSIRERLEALGGTLDVESSPGAGARLTLRLLVTAAPAVTEEEPIAGSGRRTVEMAGAPAALDQIRILLVDDHRIVREGLVSILNRHKEFQVVGEAADGVEAVSRVDELRPDVVVMDVSMPRMGGVEATRRIKSQHPGTFVIGLSLHEAEDMAQAMGEAGASAYLRKDGPSDRLFATIRDLFPVPESKA